MRPEEISVYKPTQDDIERLRPQVDHLKVSGDGVFATLQGEGITTGLPSVFLRLQYCNLTCGVPEGWLCDTEYTWNRAKPEFWQEPVDWTFQETVSKINEAWNEEFNPNVPKRLVITGGEPLIQQGKIIELLKELSEWEVEIETNGTIMPSHDLSECQFNCSPKLKNSGNKLRSRYKPKVLDIINKLPKSQFKFVVAVPDDLKEIDLIARNVNLDPEKILIMPEGQAAEDVEFHANLIQEEVERRGWKITLRSQLIWFGPKRGT